MHFMSHRGSSCLARVIPSMHVHLCVVWWLFSSPVSFSSPFRCSSSRPSRCLPPSSTRSSSPKTCATSAWGPWPVLTTRHPSHFELNFAAEIRRHPPPQAAGTVFFPMDVDDVPAARRSRPDRLLDVSGPQERVLRHTEEQAGDVVPGLPALNAPVPQMVDKLQDVLKIVDLFVPAQEIEVPRISSPSCPPPRRVLPVLQTAEQLVDVPLPAAGVVQAWVCDANGQVWSLFRANPLVAPGLRSRPVEHPAGDHRQPRAVYKYWARLRIFYGPLFLAVTCSVLVCLRSTCVDFSGSRLLDLFPCSALLGSTVDTCFFQFTEALY